MLYPIFAAIFNPPDELPSAPCHPTEWTSSKLALRGTFHLLFSCLKYILPLVHSCARFHCEEILLKAYVIIAPLKVHLVRMKRITGFEVDDFSCRIDQYAHQSFDAAATAAAPGRD